MGKLYLINVGANVSDKNSARSPIFQDGTWEYVPFPRKHRKEEGQPHPRSSLPFVRIARGIKCHLDPDWEGLSYGDCCEKGRARALAKVQEGDILLFWGLLWSVTNEESVFKSRDMGWYLMGAFRVQHILTSGERLSALPEAVRRRVSGNPHVSGRRIAKAGERVFVGSNSQRQSRRFLKAVDWEVGRDGGLMHRVVRTSDGQRLGWKNSPRWNSVTRSCRAILDLDRPGEKSVGQLLAIRIEERNPGFDLLDGV